MNQARDQEEHTISPELSRGHWMEVLACLDATAGQLRADRHNPENLMRADYVKDIKDKLAEQILPKPQQAPKEDQEITDGDQSQEETA